MGLRADDLERAWELLARQRLRINMAFVDSLRGVTRHFLLQSRAARASETATGITQHLNGLRALLRGGASAGLQARLLATTGETAMVAAHNAFLLGMPGLAQRRLDLGLRMAREAGNRQLQAAFLAREAEFTHSGRYGLAGDGAEALRLLEDAVQLAGSRSDPLLRAGLLASRGEQQAAVGNLRDCLHDLERAAELLERHGPFGPGLLPISNPTELEAVRGNAEVLMAGSGPGASRAEQARRAAERLARVHATMPAQHGAWRATVLADQGAAYALLGEAEEAARTLAGALELTLQAGARHNVTRIAGHRRRHLGKVRAPAVRELDDRLRAVSTSFGGRGST